MKEYSYKDIRKITKDDITFSDGDIISFCECRYEWAKENNKKFIDSVCIALRDILAKTPYFLFYTKDRVKLIFPHKGI